MLKQFKYPLLLFLIGVFITIFGSWAKILHLAFADGVLTVGMHVVLVTPCMFW
jgi:uncharacterized membrane protein